MPIDARRMSNALARKGFERDDSRDHIWFRHKLGGKYTGPATKISHSAREISGSLVSAMKKQLRLDSPRQLEDLVNCPMSSEDYIAHLRRCNVID